MVAPSAIGSMKLEWGAPGWVIFGNGQVNRIGDLAAMYGSRVLLVTGSSSLKKSGNLDRIQAALTAAGVEQLHSSISGETSVRFVDDLAGAAIAYEANVIVAIGGGSVIDAAKAASGLATHRVEDTDSILDFLEGVGSGKVIRKPALPVIAVPTTAGTGAEATKNAVIRDDARTFKKSIRSPFLRPAVALVDPELTLSNSRELIAACGFDALTQLIESFTANSGGSVFAEGWTQQGLRMAPVCLEAAYDSPENRGAREGMAMASLLSGHALDTSGLGAVHGLASPLGAFFDIPHGVICANLLPEITAANIEAAKRGNTDADRRALARYDAAARLVHESFRREDLVKYLQELRAKLEVPSLNSYGITLEGITRIVADCRGGSMRTNCVTLDDETLFEVLAGRIINPT